jgi:hypothetical protein
MSVEGEGRNLEDGSNLMEGIEAVGSLQEGAAAERRIGDLEIPNALPTQAATFALDIAVLGGTNPAALSSPPKAGRAIKAKSKSKSKTAVASELTKRKSRAKPKDKQALTSSVENSASAVVPSMVSAMVDDPLPQTALVRPKRKRKAPSKPGEEATRSDIGDDSSEEEVRTLRRTRRKAY